MVIREQDKVIAQHMYRVAVGLVERGDGNARALARAALDRPAPDTIRPLMDAGKGRPWLPMLVDAMSQVGVAAAEDVLGDGQQIADAADLDDLNLGGDDA